MHALGDLLVVVPHPDDESIGCGGLLALAGAAGSRVTVALMTGGESSHPRSTRWPAAARIEVRRAELDAALAALGVPAGGVVEFGRRDGGLPSDGQPGFDEAADALSTLIGRVSPGTLLAPWRRDPHPDHRAASQIAVAALARATSSARLVEYLVWSPERGGDEDRPRPGEVLARRLDIAAAVDRKRHAVAAHRSQHGLVFDDDPDGFVLPRAMRDRCGEPHELYYESEDRSRRPTP